MAKARVNIDIAVPKTVKDFIEHNEKVVAGRIEQKAKATTVFIDKTGMLRKRIKAKESKYADGGWIVEATAPHAHLVEYGHEIINWRTGQATGKRTKAAKFLRGAKEQTIAEAIAIFGAK